MVCISCFIAPVVLFLWYRFIYPVLQPLLNRLFAGYQLPQPFANLTCPLPQKSKTSATDDHNNSHTSDGESKTSSTATTAAADDESKKFD